METYQETIMRRKHTAVHVPVLQCNLIPWAELPGNFACHGGARM